MARIQKVKWAVSDRAKDSRRPLRLAELLPAWFCSHSAASLTAQVQWEWYGPVRRVRK